MASDKHRIADASPASSNGLAYRPIIRSYFAVAGLYYAAMTPTHYFSLAGVDALALIFVSTLTSLICGWCWIKSRADVSLTMLESMAGMVDLAVIVNVTVAINLEYNEAKLAYYVMLPTIFAFASVTVRQALASIALALLCMYLQLTNNASDKLAIYGFVAFGAAISSVGITIFIRRAINMALDERRAAEIARAEAERRVTIVEGLKEEMRLQSMTDSLTELPNRRGFFARLDDVRTKEARSGDAWLVLLDLDGFKAVNDNFGHMLGDELLKAVSRRLAQYCASNAFVSRMGGDEFNIILLSGMDEERMEQWSARLLEVIAEAYLIEDRLIRISGSIGCCRISPDEPDTKTIQKGDFALLQAKRTGKNRVTVFRDEYIAAVEERTLIEQALRSADFGDEIELVFQPQCALADNRIVGLEALARWNSPSVGKVVPDRFIKIAEESGLIAGVTLAVLDKVLAFIKPWQEPLPVSINLSGNDLMTDQVIDGIVEKVRRSKINPALIEFEVTETAMMPDLGRARANLLRLSELGHPITLDDFGTGYSNFNYLRTLPIDKLKIDKCFLEDISDPASEKVLQSLVAVARSLEVRYLFEGIENELQLLMAKRVGGELAQGFLFGKPMEFEDVRALLEPRRPGELAQAG